MEAIDKRIQVLNELVSRAQLAAKMGVQYGGERELYSVLGYKLELTYADYWAQYDRQDIAAAIINKPVEATWRGSIDITESSDADETQLEKGWKELNKRLKLKTKFVSLDKQTCIGQYGVLFLGLSDATTKEKLMEPPTGRPKLLYLKTYSEQTAKIDKFETDQTNERFGLPKIYNISISDGKGSIVDAKVHYSRIIHVTYKALTDEVYGTPALKKVYNRLMDLEKLTGGSAEMFWRGARPGYTGKLDEGYQLSADDETELLQQLDEYEHNLRRILVNRGIDLKGLAPQVSDPSSHVDIQIQMISADTGIPKRILMGSERGELASGQDETAWKELIQTRREEYAEQAILRPFIDRCQELGILPAETEDGYSIAWSDLFAPSDKERAEVGKTRAEALKQYAGEPMAEYIIPPEAFFEFFLGLSNDEITLINQMKEEAMLEPNNEPTTTIIEESDTTE